MVDMGKASRDKGARGEREFAELVSGHRVPLSGAVDGYSNDVVLPNGMKAEVKLRASGFKTLYDWIEDERENPDVVAFRADRKQWLVAMTAGKFLHLLEAGKILEEVFDKWEDEDVTLEGFVDFLCEITQKQKGEPE